MGAFLCNFCATDMKYYLDKRNVGKDGKCSLRIRIAKDGKYLNALTGVRIAPDDWDAERGRSKTDGRLNVRIKDMLDNADDFVLRLKASGQYRNMTVHELAEEISRKVLIRDIPMTTKNTLAAQMEAYRDRQQKAGTREVYDRTIRTLERYDPEFRSRKLGEIDHRYIASFDGWCSAQGMKVNSISILLRNIRTVFNEARNDGLTANYPFQRYRIRQEPTRKRSLSVEDLRRLAELDIPEDQQRYRDYFFLMIYLIGINTTDLFHAKPEDLKDGRLWYVRDKTGKPYSVKVEPEAMEIIDRYRGKDWLLEPLDHHEEFLSWRSQLNKRLKALGQITGKRGKVVEKGPFPELSTYWARHTWATIAYEIGISVDIIGQALGHSDRSHAVTFIYIKPESSKVDEANRKVIDHIKKGLTSQPDPLPEK